jgi:hypothetical protein
MGADYCMDVVTRSLRQTDLTSGGIGRIVKVVLTNNRCKS